MGTRIKKKTNEAQETQIMAQSIAKKLKAGDILCLYGDLGSGKTTFVKGLTAGLSIKSEDVSSPTFVLMNVYEGRLPVYHFDFYRLESEKEIAGLGYDEFLFGEGVAVIEWSERFGSLLPTERLDIRILMGEDTDRHFQFSAHGLRYQKLIEHMQKSL